MFYSCVKSHNDCIMATGSPGVKQIPVGEETSDECTGKKKSKFQTFKKFFGKKKKKEPPASSRDSNLKPSQSSSDVSTAEPQNIEFNSPSDLGSKGSMGNKALSHDSVFISEPASDDTTGDRLSQEATQGKVKALQLQLQSNIRVGSSPQVITNKTGDDAGAVSEDDGLPQSPPEISTLHEILACSSSKSFKSVEHRSSLSLGGTDSEDEQLSSESLSRPVSPLSSILLPVDFNLPASTLGCLDNSAAKHKIFLNPRRHRDRDKRSKIAAEARAAREQLPRLSEEESSTEPLLEASQLNRSSEGLDNVRKEKMSGIFGDAEKLDIAEQRLAASRTPSEATNHVAALNKSSLEETEIFSPNDENVLTPKVCNLEYRKKEDDKAEDLIAKEKRVHYPPSGSISESEMQVHTTSSSGIETNVTPEKLKEPATCQTDTDLASVLISDMSEPNTLRNELTPKDQKYSLKPANQTENKPLAGTIALAANVALTSGNEIHAIVPETDLSVDSAQNLQLTSRISAEKEAALCDSLERFAPKSTSDTAEDGQLLPKELSPKDAQPLDNMEEAQSYLQQSIPIDSSDFNTHSVEESTDIPREVEVESSEDTVKRAPEESNTSLECISRASASDFEACPVSVNSVVMDHIPVTVTQATKTSKATDEIAKSLHKSTKTPVRFTIAPAWQRSLSGGSSAKEEAAVGCAAPSTTKAELFEKNTEGQTFLGRVRSASSPTSSEDIDMNTDIPRTAKRQSEHVSQSTELPFGVRLKRAPSLSKHSDEDISDSQKPESSVSQVSLVKDIQKSENAGKTVKIPSGLRKSSLHQADLPEEKDLHSTRAEELPKKSPTAKSLEKGITKPVGNATSEPVWVSMAKLKQKGFQGHPLAKEQSATEQVGTTTITEKVTNCGLEEGSRKSVFISTVDQEKTLHVDVANRAAAVGHGPQGTAPSAALDKGTREPPILPATLQNPAEPPWLSLAKKKAKAWSEMPQIVQ